MMYNGDEVSIMDMATLLSDYLADLEAATPERLIAEMERARVDSSDAHLFDDGEGVLPISTPSL